MAPSSSFQLSVLLYSCYLIVLAATQEPEYYKTGEVDENGVPNGPVDLAPPTFQEIMDFGTERSGDAFDNIMKRNSANNSTKMCIIEGDIAAPCDNASSRKRRNALRDRSRRWKDGIVPYVIDNRFDEGARGRIMRGINRYHATTCIRFKPRTTEQDYVYIFPGNGCFSLVGRVGGMQQLSLGTGCTTNLGTIVHELMHAIGFHHEQARSDRDQYVIIYRQNIIKGQEHNFRKYEQTYIDHVGTAYDYVSVMHYSMTAFSSNGQPTIVSRDPNIQLDSRSDFSPNDIDKINIYYECDGTITRPTEPTLPGDMDCMDLNAQCKEWAEDGYCSRNPSWMHQNCMVSCGICDPSTGTSEKDECKDVHDNCAAWASDGYCEENPSWMLPNCPVSCDQCDITTPTEECKDDSSFCSIWALFWKCTEDSDYMTENCARSCGLCSARLMTSCEDYHDNCAELASNDQCTLNPGYMNYECRKSCSLCAASSPLELLPQVHCEDTTGYCSIYAEDGMCESKPDYMGLACPDTCRMCPGQSYMSGASQQSIFGFLSVLAITVIVRGLTN